MWATCLQNEIDVIRDAAAESQDVASAHYYLTINRSYPVLGMSLTDDQLLLLILDDTHFPMFCPTELFAPWGAPIPSDWHFALASGRSADGEGPRVDPIQAIWGYLELVEDPGHYTAIVDGDPLARRVFDHRYREALNRPGHP